MGLLHGIRVPARNPRWYARLDGPNRLTHTVNGPAGRCTVRHKHHEAGIRLKTDMCDTIKAGILTLTEDYQTIRYSGRAGPGQTKTGIP